MSKIKNSKFGEIQSPIVGKKEYDPSVWNTNMNVECESSNWRLMSFWAVSTLLLVLFLSLNA